MPFSEFHEVLLSNYAKSATVVYATDDIRNYTNHYPFQGAGRQSELSKGKVDAFITTTYEKAQNLYKYPITLYRADSGEFKSAISSWTHSKAVAEQFVALRTAEGIPVTLVEKLTDPKDIFSSYEVGIGDKIEQEFLVFNRQ